MTLVLAALATAYVTYVLTESELPFLVRLRTLLGAWKGDDSWPAYLSTCGWCMSFYTSGATVGLTSLVVNIPLPGLVWLATAFLSGLLLLLVQAVSSYQMRNIHEILSEEPDGVHD